MIAGPLPKGLSQMGKGAIKPEFRRWIGEFRHLSKINQRSRGSGNELTFEGLSMEPGNDMKAHSKTYGSFIGMLKWAIPVIAIITAIVVILISG